VRVHRDLMVLAGALALVGIALLFLAWLVQRPPRQEAAGQELIVPAVTASPASPQEATAPVTSPELTKEFPSEREPEGIPGLSVLDVIGNLEHFRAEEGFVCDGPAPTDGRSMWVCSAPGGELPGTYKLTVVGEDPATVLWVAATAHGVMEEQAAEFFSYVAGLCLQETDPLNPKAWVEQNLTPGGQVFAEGTELTIYGTKEEWTLQVVATDFAVD
jgi:hypothetical protein